MESPKVQKVSHWLSKVINGVTWGPYRVKFHPSESHLFSAIYKDPITPLKKRSAWGVFDLVSLGEVKYRLPSSHENRSKKYVANNCPRSYGLKSVTYFANG